MGVMPWCVNPTKNNKDGNKNWYTVVVNSNVTAAIVSGLTSEAANIQTKNKSKIFSCPAMLYFYLSVCLSIFLTSC